MIPRSVLLAAIDRVITEESSQRTVQQVILAEKLADAVMDLLRPKFSTTITQTEVRRKCDQGHEHVIHRLHWRAMFVPVLKLCALCPLTTTQIGDRFIGAMSATARKCPSELIHFGLLEVCGKKNGLNLYAATAAGKAFLAGNLKAPAWAWPKDVALPPECQDGPGMGIGELLIASREPCARTAAYA